MKKIPLWSCCSGRGRVEQRNERTWLPSATSTQTSLSSPGTHWSLCWVSWCDCVWVWVGMSFFSFFFFCFCFCLGWLFFTCTTGICTRVHVQLSIVFFFCVPQLYLWGSPFWVRFLWVWRFLNPTIEVVIFRLCGWCMMGVFLLLTFTRLGHECQDLLSPWDGLHVCTDWISVYTLIWKSFGGMESEIMLTPRETFPLLEAQRRVDPATLHFAEQ